MREEDVNSVAESSPKSIIKALKDIKDERLIMNTSFTLVGDPLIETHRKPKGALQ